MVGHPQHLRYCVLKNKILSSIPFSNLEHTMRFHPFDTEHVQFVSLAVFIEGIVTLMVSDDLLACFAAGSKKFVRSEYLLTVCMVAP